MQWKRPDPPPPPFLSCFIIIFFNTYTCIFPLGVQIFYVRMVFQRLLNVTLLREKQHGLAFVRVNLKRKKSKKKFFLKKAILFNFSFHQKRLNSSEEVEPWFEMNGAQISFATSFFLIIFFSPRNNDQSFEYQENNLICKGSCNWIEFMQHCFSSLDVTSHTLAGFISNTTILFSVLFFLVELYPYRSFPTLSYSHVTETLFSFRGRCLNTVFRNRNYVLQLAMHLK